MTSRWRLWTAGILVLLGVALAISLIPPYLENLQFQRYLEQVVSQPDSRTLPADLLRVQILNEASRLGLPLRQDQIEIRRSQERLRVEARYIVRVDLALYTVDLHFRPIAGS